MTYQDTIRHRAVDDADAERRLPGVRSIGPRDLVDALSKGLDDFLAVPTHAVFLSLLYPLAGLIIAGLTLSYDLIPLLFPMAAGFALVGPVAAIGTYELSRRREQGLDTHWTHAFDLLQADSFRGIVALGLLLLVIFGIWIAAAQAIYIAYFGYAAPESISTFVRDVLTTQAGHHMIMVGNLVGFLFALAAFAVSVISFPLLIDRKITATAAAVTSIRVILRNPLTMALWGLIVAAALLIGSLPFFAGLAIVIPVLGHASWHLYRRVVVADDLLQREPHPTPPWTGRHAADFPAVLFPVHDKKSGGNKT